MKIAIAGGHGTIARHLARQLVSSGHTVLSLIRDPAQSDDITDLGAVPTVVDLESTTADALAAAIEGADTVVFAAGAGPGSGHARKESVDHQGAVTLLAAAERIGAGHYVMISSMGADRDHPGDEAFDVYLRAKGQADDAVRASQVSHTIVRPTSLTDDEPVGTVRLDPEADGDPISRADVAGVLAEIIDRRAGLERTLQLTAGTTPLADAVASLG